MRPFQRLKGAALSAAYRTYLWAFSGSEDVFALSERVVEYPFAMQALSGLPRGSRVALVGCHGDLLTTILSTIGFSTHGLDIKPYLQQWPNFQFVECDARRTGLESDFFDAVVIVSTIEHIGLFDDDPDGDHKAMREAVRMLRPGGILVATVPFGSSPAVIPLRQRIYNEQSLLGLIDAIELDQMEVRELKDGWWQPIDPGAAPAPAVPTRCVGMVRGRKPGALASSS